VDEIITTFQSKADYDASKVRDRASVDALSQSEQKKASEALMSPKQTNVTFNTSGAPPNSSPAVASCFLTPKRPAQHNTPVLRVDTAPASVAPSPVPGPTVPESNAAQDTTATRSKATATGAAKSAAPHAGKTKAKLPKIP
jgi:hypothetical protein